MHDTLYMCIYSDGLGAYAAWARARPSWGVPSRKSPQPARIYTHVWCIMHALVHFGECANPFWRMRQSILSNAPIYFDECLILFSIFTSLLLFYYYIIFIFSYVFLCVLAITRRTMHLFTIWMMIPESLDEIYRFRTFRSVLEIKNIENTSNYDRIYSENLMFPKKSWIFVDRFVPM